MTTIIHQVENEDRIASQFVKQCQEKPINKQEANVDALSVVYEALLQAFANQQKVEADDIEIVKSNITLQKQANTRLDTLNFESIPDFDAQVMVQRYLELQDFRNSGFFQILDPATIKIIENAILTADNDLLGKLDSIGLNHRDCVKEAKAIIKEATEKATINNTRITKERESVSNDITIAQQQAQLASSYCQSTSSRLTQTSSTFTALLAANKGAIEQIYK